MGYYVVNLQKVVYVQPWDLGPNVRRSLESNLRSAVEGSRVDDVGLLVAVKDILDPGDGKVLDDGRVAYNINYEGVAFGLYKGEVLDGIVTEVKPEAVIADCGATRIYISRHQIPPGFNYETDGVSSRFVTRSGDASLQKGEIVRLRIIAETGGRDDEYGAIGTIKGEWLGPRI